MPAYKNLKFARVDLDRAARRGFPEVIYAQGKTASQVKAIAKTLQEAGSLVIATKVSSAMARRLEDQLPQLKYFPQAGILAGPKSKLKIGRNGQGGGKVLVICAGTSDIPVAEEAAVTLEVLGKPAQRLFDVGVAGIHRLLRHKKKIQQAKAIIVVAGMDGALPSVVSGLARCPVVAVPTSVGYGASFKGVAPLLAMLNSCSPGVAVVNIDNGFGAGYLAAML